MPTDFFVDPGTFTWTAPLGVTTVDAVVIGGGGGGGTGDQGDGSVFYGGGGGAGGGGEYNEATIPVTPGLGYTVIVGDFGAGQGWVLGGVSGGNGGDSSFTGDSSITVTGQGGVGGTGANDGVNGVGGGGGLTTGQAGGDGGTGAGGGAIGFDPPFPPGGGGGGGAVAFFNATGTFGNNGDGDTGGTGGDNGDGDTGGDGGSSPGITGDGTDGQSGTGVGGGGGGGAGSAAGFNAGSSAFGGPGFVSLTYTPSGGGGGDPHFIGFDGKRFNYHGKTGSTYLIYDDGKINVSALFTEVSNNITFMTAITVRMGEETHYLTPENLPDHTEEDKQQNLRLTGTVKGLLPKLTFISGRHTGNKIISHPSGNVVVTSFKRDEFSWLNVTFQIKGEPVATGIMGQTLLPKDKRLPNDSFIVGDA